MGFLPVTWQTRAIRTSEIKKAKAAFYMKGKQKTRKNSDLSKGYEWLLNKAEDFKRVFRKYL